MRWVKTVMNFAARTILSLLLMTSGVRVAPAFALVEAFACKEPQKTEAQTLLINWELQRMSFGSQPSARASYWGEEAIHWDAVLHGGERASARVVSYQYTIASKTLMYTILDPTVTMPKTDEDWAMFLPVYFTCKLYY